MDDQWGDQLNFEFIDWNDVTEAEQSGDQDAIERLMNQSLEIRRQNSMSETPHSSEPTTPCFDYSTPNEAMPFANFHDNQEQIDPNIINSAPPRSLQNTTTPFLSRSSMAYSKRIKSYAQITRGAGKVGKRRINERIGLSPTDLPKRKSFRELLSPPPVFPGRGVTTTPDQSLPITTEMGEIDLGVDTSTPETDRFARGGGVQRRLFGGQTSSPQQQTTKQSIGCPPPWHAKPDEDKLIDLHKLAQRQRQIDMGKETLGYELYSQQIPKWKRGRVHPWTPDKYKSCSTRAWQGQIKQWRRNLHKFDIPAFSTSQAQQQFTVEDVVLCGMTIDNGESPLD